ncbi:MAG: hypothetical protein ACFFB3_01310 [Candidatus Hodarchaeota archaeon]
MSDVSPSILGLSIYGLKPEEVEDTLRTYKISHKRAKSPGLCSRKSERQEQGYTSAGDELDFFFCYWLSWSCPSPGYGRHAGHSNCEADDEAGALILGIILIMVLMVIIIAVAPFIFAAAAFLIDIFIAGAIGLFDLMTFGIFRKYLRKTHFHLHSPDYDALNNVYMELVAKGGLPKAPGYWTHWYAGVRMGAVLTVGGILTAALILLLGGGGWLWGIPIGLIVLAIFLLGFGTWSIRRRRKGILQRLGPPPKKLPT